MIDAGSTGSRIHSFTFNKDQKDDLHLLSEDFYAVKPGLSSYKGNDAGAKESITSLIKRAKKVVPKSHWPATPVYLRATAGLRMLGEAESEAVLESVRQVLKESGFRFDGPSWASILGGNDEGVYSWITVNYLLGKDKTDTVGTLEMGGGSSQVAFVPKIKSKDKGSNCSTPEIGVDYKGEKLPLYTQSHLRYGIKKAKAVALKWFEDEGKLIDNPCINQGALKVDVPFQESKTLKMTGTGDYAKCRNLVDDILGGSVKSCNCRLCTYGGSAQPRPISTYVAFAFYAERTVKLGLPSKLTVADIRAKGEEICGMSLADVEKRYVDVSNGKASDLCFDLAFVASNLELGHGLKESLGTELLVMNKVNDVELGWSLGAMFAELSNLGTADRS